MVEHALPWTDLFYIATYIGEAIALIFYIRLHYKNDQRLAKLEDQDLEETYERDKDRVRAELLNEYITRDKLQNEHIARLSKELGYYKAKAGVELNHEEKHESNKHAVSDTKSGNSEERK